MTGRSSRSTSTRSGAPRTATPRAERVSAPKPIERDYGVCDVCFMVRNANGTCGCD